MAGGFLLAARCSYFEYYILYLPLTKGIRMKIISLLISIVLLYGCIDDGKGHDPSYKDITLQGAIDPGMSFYVGAQYTLTRRDKMKCKSWSFNLFSGGDKWRLNQKIKYMTSRPTIEGDQYHVTIPMSEISEDSDCSPVLTSLTLCLYERVPQEKYCSQGIYIGDELQFCLAESVEDHSSCRAFVYLVDQYETKAKNLTDLDYSSGLVQCQSFDQYSDCILKDNKTIKSDDHHYNIDMKIVDQLVWQMILYI